MVTYTKDDDAIQVYDGSNFVGVGSDSGLIHIETRTFTTSSAESFNNVFSATYENYKIFSRYNTSTGSNQLMRLRVGGSDDTGTGYSYVLLTTGFTNNNLRITGTSQTSWILHTSTGGGTEQSIVDISRPNFAQTTTSTFQSFDTSGGDTRVGSLYFSAGTVFDGFTLFPASGTITGTISVYGYAKA
jgi:hypothetical protein